jgi:hypothetical protein
MKRAGSGSGTITLRYGSADPDPYQNVMDPENRRETINQHLSYRESLCMKDVGFQNVKWFILFVRGFFVNVFSR